jgi:hypothetical protein
MAGAENAWRDALRAVTVADLARDVGSDSGPDALATFGKWLSSAEA